MVAPVPTCDFSWTGFYIGVRAGYGWSDNDDIHIRLFEKDTDFVFDPNHQSIDYDGFVGGGELGFNWQFGKWFVLGAEADLSGSTIDGGSTQAHATPELLVDSPDTADFHANQEINWYGTVRGRIGFVPWCRVMIYGTGGFAYGDVRDEGDIDFTPFGGVSHLATAHSGTDTGWAAGGGVEYAFNKHWTFKVEYLHIDLGDHSSPARQRPDLNQPSSKANFSWDNEFHTVTGGINFKF